MTRIRIQGGLAQGFYVLTAHGHADFNPGNDIVCASVSGIVYALAGVLENLPQDSLYHREQPGDFCVFCRSRDRAVYGAFLMAEVGLRQIEKEYPGYVEVL